MSRVSPRVVFFALLAACGSETTARPLSTPDAAVDTGRPIDVGASASADGAADQRGETGFDLAPDVTGRSDTNAGDTIRGDASSPVDVVSADAGGDLNAADAGALRCNGHAALCDRRFDQVVFPATHNSMSNAADPWFAPNQEHGIARQLQDGIRALLIDTYAWRGGLFLCHTACELGNRPLADGLRDIAGFLRANPNEVLALLIEDHISPADTERVFRETGLLDAAYVHPAGAAWPTLRTMIASGRRLLVTNENQRSMLPWYHHLWDLASDTPYTFKNAQEFSCRANRGAGSNALFLLNHWIENPLAAPSLSRTANARDLLLGRAKTCQGERGKLPNFVAVNHYATGDLFAVVRALNGLSD